MTVRKSSLARIALMGLVMLAPLASKSGKGGAVAVKGTPALWRDPAGAKDLYYGVGSKDREPRAPFQFVKEDLEGSNPKFVVKDADGVKWKIKLGQEARAETTASRIVWAAGYFANEDYLVPEIQVNGMPTKVKRHKMIEPGGVMRNVRFKREEKSEEKVGTWKWKDNPFRDTREWNGLRVMMALVNNWDVKDVNNAIYKKDGQLIYVVSDIGATFGAASRVWPHKYAKDNLEAYSKSCFVKRETANLVDFCSPGRPSWHHWVDPKEAFKRLRLEWIGHDIPRGDARWMGGVLSRLTSDQIRDAFRAGGYSKEEIEGFTRVVNARIGELNEM